MCWGTGEARIALASLFCDGGVYTRRVGRAASRRWVATYPGAHDARRNIGTSAIGSTRVPVGVGAMGNALVARSSIGTSAANCARVPIGVVAMVNVARAGTGGSEEGRVSCTETCTDCATVA